MDIRKDGHMIYKYIGAILIVAGCGGCGFSIAAGQLRAENMLRELTRILDFMECELQYRLTPLPELCYQAGQESAGSVRKVFLSLAQELEAQLSPDVSACMQVAVRRANELPSEVRGAFLHLGSSMGRFDLVGQLKGLESVRAECREKLEKLTCDRETRLRSYQTLGLCAGAALVILFL